ncbi:translation elongation factor Ts [Salinivirga cyanobacteriivorans]|uniref:Elongation factor Ts n=1 Tax=Salinivirga cyanobacteriivorans TaxID=1307839 RepID=A0A0S2I144_9BACT|nr:translation elongation factor Ts [Salinivirga cyanobacteriivorans]ALO15966.1 Elongation factor Ts [Salinivirga cyanobacteriivorans]
MAIKAADVAKLRKMTGAGMMDCKKALEEANGDFDGAVKIIRERGQEVAKKRSDREASEGVVLAKVSDDKKKGAIVVLNCETDFVAKNDDFVKFASEILDKAIEEAPADLEALKAQKIGDTTIGEKVTEQVGIIGEKIELSYYAFAQAEDLTAYIHPGNKLASLVGFDKSVGEEVGKDVAMQVAAMAPVAIDKDGVKQEVIDQELEIYKEKSRQEGKPEEMLDKIAQGRLNKFFKENTLINQEFVKEGKKSVGDYVKEQAGDAKIVAMERYTLNA